MLREYCGADEAVQHAYRVTQMEAFKPCQRRAGNVLGAMEAPIVVYLSGHCALLPSIAASCQPFKVRDHRHPLVLKSDTVHPGDSFLFPRRRSRRMVVSIRRSWLGIAAGFQTMAKL